MQWLALAVSLLAVLISGGCALLAWSLNRRSQTAQAHEQINQRYDRLMAFRASHPEVLAMGFRWTHDSFARMYAQENEQDRAWALYYTYVELVLGFCNAVAYAARRGFLDRTAYDEHYRPLVRLLLTEHQPIVAELVLSGHYVSQFVRQMWEEFETEGWDWKRRHLDLRGK